MFIPAVGLTEPSIRCVLEVQFPGSKRPGRKAEYSLPYYSDVKSEWSCTSPPPFVSTAGTGITVPSLYDSNKQQIYDEFDNRL